MEQNLPRGGDIVIQRPFGGGVGVGIVLILQYLVVVEHLQGSPLGIEEIGKVVEVQSYIEGLSATGDVELDLL